MSASVEFAPLKKRFRFAIQFVLLAILWAVSVPMRNVGQSVVDAVAVNPSPTCSGATCTIQFTYTGDFYEWTVPSGTTTIGFDVRGASGGDGVYPGGNGGTVTGTMNVTGMSTLFIYVGGAGASSTTSGQAASGGWNGGANSGASTNAYVRGGGGGASDIRTVSGVWNNALSLASRKVVAGGGGGSNRQGNSCCYAIGQGGAGGGTTGGVTDTSDGVSGRGGTQAAGGAGSGNGSAGSLATGGVGGDGGSLYFGGGGGGGGYYGGGGGNGSGGNQWSTGGGGGSSYPSASGGIYTNIVHTRGTTDGNGVVTLTYPNGPTATVAPQLTGTAAVGQTLTASAPTWVASGGTVTITGRQWQFSTDNVSWANIAGATNSSYVLTNSESGGFVRYVETASDVNGSGSTRSVASVQVTNSPAWTSNNGNVTTTLVAGSPITPFTFAASGYRMTYSISSGALPTGLSLHPMTGVLSGTPSTPGSYVVTIRGSNDSGNADSTFAFTVNGTPSAPTISTIGARNAAVNIAWTVPSSNGSAITDYEIQYCTGGTCTTFIDGVSTTTSAQVTGLVNGVSYTFVVRAINGLGNGSFSTASASVSPDGIAPTLSLQTSASVSNSQSVTFILSGNESIDCSTVSGMDFVGTNVSSIDSITQSSSSSCAISVTSSVTAGSSATTNLSASGSFSVADMAGNSQTAISNSSLGVAVTIAATTTTTTTSSSLPPVTATTQPKSTKTTKTTSTTLAALRPSTTSTTVAPVSSIVESSGPVAVKEAVGNVLKDMLTTAEKTSDMSTILMVKRALAQLSDATSVSEIEKVLAEVGSSPRLPSLHNGVLPRQSLGEWLLRSKNARRKSTPSIRNGSLVVSEVNGVEFTLTARTSDGKILPIENGRIVVERNNKISVDGTGFSPSSEASVWLFSEPLNLGNITVSADGTFDVSLDITSDVPIGSHTAHVHGIGADGEERSLDIGLIVRNASVDADSADSVDVNAESSGGQMSGLAGGVIAVSLAGVVIWFVLRRRRRDSH